MTDRAACAIVVFAKAPVAGYAKTRLAGALGAEGAARLAERLLGHAVGQAVDAGIGPVELCCAPDAGHPALRALARRHRIDVALQGDGDLGVRLARAVQRNLCARRAVIVIGTDSPALGADDLREAARLLETHDAVLGPAQDGGYTLIGLKDRSRLPFERIAWSTPLVLRQTRERLVALGLRHAELREIADIDTPGDLDQLPAGWLVSDSG